MLLPLPRFDEGAICLSLPRKNLFFFRRVGDKWVEQHTTAKIKTYLTRLYEDVRRNDEQIVMISMYTKIQSEDDHGRGSSF